MLAPCCIAFIMTITAITFVVIAVIVMCLMLAAHLASQNRSCRLLHMFLNPRIFFFSNPNPKALFTLEHLDSERH